MSVEEFEALPDEEVFTTISNYSPGSIAPVWAKGAPYEFLKAVEFHNHVCPGLTSGYYLIKYLDENLPLQSSSDRYEIIGCPSWCKDDALQVILDKRHFVVMHLTPEDQKQLPGYYEGPGRGGVAGIYIRWNRTTNTGHGMVLAYNRTKASEVGNILLGLEPDGGLRLKTILALMDYLDQPEMFVSAVHEFDLNGKAELMELKYAGNNPYVVLGLLPDPALANLVGPDNIAVGNRLGCRASEFAMENMSFEKYDPNILAMTDAGYLGARLAKAIFLSSTEADRDPFGSHSSTRLRETACISR
jgi:formylmethanofuran dehydrogenase subunit E-like metal-binding protein